MTDFHIGPVAVPNRCVLAPMAGISDLPFRILCREQGVGLVCMEMVSAKAILHDNAKTALLLATADGESPVSLQLFGADPAIISEAAARIEERPFDILDINMGCPVPKVVNNGEGAALMKDPRLAAAIIEKTVRAIKKPVTVKIRKGFTAAHANAVEMARIAEDSGAAAITIHGRSRDQFYSGEADWDIIAAVKAAVSIPVIGNGDVRDAQTAAAMFAHSGCDAVMVGRAARGNPWLFREIAAYLADPAHHGSPPATHFPKPPPAAITAMIRRHADLMIYHKGEATALRELRKHLAWYTSGLPGAATLRRQAVTITTCEQLEAWLGLLGSVLRLK